MPDPIAWDCLNPRCRNRNPWRNEHCYECRWPRYSGQPLAHVVISESDLRPVPQPVEPHSPLATIPRFPGWAWALGGIVLFTLTVVAWPVVLIGLFFALLWAIAAGIWRIATRSENPANR